MEVEGLDALDLCAYAHDGESEDYFVTRGLPGLAERPEAELWALAGMFLSRVFTASDPLDVAARFIARYATLVRALEHPGDPRPDPLKVWADWRFSSPEGGPTPPPLTSLAEGVSAMLRNLVFADDDDEPPKVSPSR